MAAKKINLKNTTLHFIKDVYLNEIHLGILDTRGEGTFKTTYIDFFFSKIHESEKRIGVSEILIKDSSINFSKVVLEIENVRYITVRNNFIKPDDSNKYDFKGQSKLRLPLSCFTISKIQLSLFDKDEV